MCVNQKIIYYNRMLKDDKHNGSIILDRTSDNVNYVKDLISVFGGIGSFIQCGKCIECRSKKALEWSLRCLAEYETNPNKCYFLTLTYNDYNLPKNSNLSIKDFRLFIDRLYHHGFKFKYYACGEYGCETKRPHYHILLWLDRIIDDLVKYDNKLFTSNYFNKLWNKGDVKIGFTDVGSIFYVGGYVSKKLSKDEDFEVPEFQRFSKGIGLDYFNLHYKEMLKDDKIYFNGKAYGLPRYFSKLLKSRFPATFEILRKKRFNSNFNDFNISNKSDRVLHFSQKQKERLLEEYNKLSKIRDF